MSNVGRPPVYKSPKELDKKIQEYLDETTEKKLPLTISGLCYHCGFESRQSFYAYEKKPEFSYTIKRARLAIEVSYEMSLHKQSVSGAIFALKNLGWIDEQTISHEVSTPNKFTISFRNESDPNTAAEI